MILGIVGAGGHAKVVADAALRTKLWDEIIFFDDGHQESLQQLPGKLIGSTNLVYANRSVCFGFIVAIGDCGTRKKICEEMRESGIKIVSVVDPSAVISPSAEVEEGVVIMANSVINAGAFVSRGAIVNTSVIVEHDCVVGDYAHLSPGVVITGGVSVGSCTWVGAGAIVTSNSSIGSHCIVGAGSVVVKSTPSHIKIAGIPAKPL